MKSMPTLSLADMRRFLSDAVGIAQGDDFFILDITFRPGRDLRLAYPCRFEGMVTLYCIKGSFQLTIGLEDYPVQANDFAVSLPGDIIRFALGDERKSGKIRIMAISDRLLSDMDFDMPWAQHVFHYRRIHVNTYYKVLINHFRDIFRTAIIGRHEETFKSLSYMLRSMNIELAHMWQVMAPDSSQKGIQSSPLTDTFVTLVARHHVEHRDLQFYADRMQLTPKYLSAAIAQASGQSAVNWITNYVILEIKYYLKHTRLPVKEIAYELNFDNQMNLYRYFRRHTGMTPTEYREQGGL